MPLLRAHHCLEFSDSIQQAPHGAEPCPGFARPGPGLSPGLEKPGFARAGHWPYTGPGRSPWPGLGPSRAWPGTGPPGFSPGRAGPTNSCGWGAVSSESIEKGDFVIEYVGEEHVESGRFDGQEWRTGLADCQIGLTVCVSGRFGCVTGWILEL
ncbi:hypothetical protein KSP39_PZI002425 [Platanthera zijinensis]|uniref:Uncharacterized protein n=1 Tax=Platanthera zijinensis TaxID=2320716 RepID=A0AAP0BYN1_9ASPA